MQKVRALYTILFAFMFLPIYFQVENSLTRLFSNRIGTIIGYGASYIMLIVFVIELLVKKRNTVEIEADEN